MMFGAVFVVADQPPVRSSQPKARFTAQRRLTAWKPGASLRLMISKVMPAAFFTQAARGLPSYPEPAHISRSVVNAACSPGSATSRRPGR
jgi:hypothetical protein